MGLISNGVAFFDRTSVTAEYGFCGFWDILKAIEGENEVIMGESRRDGMKNGVFWRLTFGIENRQGGKHVLDI